MNYSSLFELVGKARSAGFPENDWGAIEDGKLSKMERGRVYAVVTFLTISMTLSILRPPILNDLRRISLCVDLF